MTIASAEVPENRLGDWRDRARCRGKDVNLFFPNSISEGETTIRMFCRRCPVEQECLDWALEKKEDHGIWGGMQENARRRLRQQLRRRVL